MYLLLPLLYLLYEKNTLYNSDIKYNMIDYYLNIYAFVFFK